VRRMGPGLLPGPADWRMMGSGGAAPPSVVFSAGHEQWVGARAACAPCACRRGHEGSQAGRGRALQYRIIYGIAHGGCACVDWPWPASADLDLAHLLDWPVRPRCGALASVTERARGPGIGQGARPTRLLSSDRRAVDSIEGYIVFGRADAETRVCTRPRCKRTNR
jgi:hypothetical protein